MHKVNLKKRSGFQNSFYLKDNARNPKSEGLIYTKFEDSLDQFLMEKTRQKHRMSILSFVSFLDVRVYFSTKNRSIAWQSGHSALYTEKPY